jgi:phenylalanyl-tRNA synthetase beta chain
LLEPCTRAWRSAGETIKLLNEQTVELQSDVLLIADERRPLAMAGVMGGEDSGISLATTELFLEAAFFAPKRSLGAPVATVSFPMPHIVSSGVSISLRRGGRSSVRRALFVDICGGQAGPVSEALASLPERLPVRLRPRRVRKVLGMDLSPERIE